jgi:hypothetical protein
MNDCSWFENDLFPSLSIIKRCDLIYYQLNYPKAKIYGQDRMAYRHVAGSLGAGPSVSRQGT